MKKQIIGIGGGAMYKSNDSYKIEQYILQQTGKENPKICFMATATGDADRNIVKFYEVFSKFRCERAHLSLIAAPKELEEFILTQDVIYVGGGNTKYLLTLWREWGLDKILLTAYNNGVILSGFSGGLICWFEEGLSDYVPGELNPLRGLGFLNGSCCPHFDGELQRKSRYCELIAGGAMKEGVAVDDDVAVHYINDRLHKIISTKPLSKAYNVKHVDNGAQIIDLSQDIIL